MILLKRASICLLLILFFMACFSQVYTGSTTFGVNGGGSQLAPCTELLRFDNYNDNVAGTASGQDFAFILTSGDSLFFKIQRTGFPINSVPSPSCGTCSAFGLSGYTGLQGLPDLYQTQNTGNDNTVLVLSNIHLKDRNGNNIPHYTMMVFDCEATEPYESITLTAPAGFTWNYYDSVAPSVAGYTRPVASGLGTNTLTWQGTYPNAVAPFLDDGFSIFSPVSFNISLANNGSPGLEGVALGIKRQIVALNDSSCTGGNFTIQPLNAPSGTTYTWTNPVISPAGSVTGATSQSTPTDSINQTLVHTGNVVSTVTYTITPYSCGQNDSSFTATIVLGVGTPAPINLGNDTAYCGPFSRVLSTGNPSTLWSTGVTASQITVNAAGTYWANITGSCGFSSDTIHLVQNPVPTVSLGNDTLLCSGQSLILNAAGANSTYHWQDNSINPTYTVTSAGNFSVTVTNANGCSESDAIQVSITNQPPVINLGNDTSYCGSFSRVISTGNASTVWSTGVTGPQITINSAGVYWAHLSNGCGVSADTIHLIQNPVPAVNLGNDTSICSGQSLTLNSANANSSYHWQDNSINPTYNVTAAGNYAVTVTNATGCSATDAIQVSVVSQPPTINLGNDTTYCGNFSRVISTGAVNTIWSTGVTASQITITTPGLYWAKESNGCGTSSDSISISQNPLPAINLGNDTALCSSQSLTLSAANPNATYLWQDNSTNATYNVTAAGTYAVTATNPSGCSATDSIKVIYDTQKPVINLGNDTTYCQQFSRMLSTGLANTMWSNNVVAAQITANNPGIYWAQATNACGTTRDSIVLYESSKPQLSFSNALSICPGDTITLQPSTTANHFLWNTGDSTIAIPVIQPGTYSIEAWNNIACPGYASITIPPGNPPAINLGGDTSLCTNTGLLLSLNVNNAHFAWQDNSTDSFYNVTSSGTYSVTVTNNCGSSTAQKRVEIYIDECALLIPTAFSPNNDGKNDVFRAISRCPVEKFTIRIFNRWGQEIFESNDINSGWDGTFKNIAQPLDVYVYYIEYYNYCKAALDKRSGNITLLR